MWCVFVNGTGVAVVLFSSTILLSWQQCCLPLVSVAEREGFEPSMSY